MDIGTECRELSAIRKMKAAGSYIGSAFIRKGHADGQIQDIEEVVKTSRQVKENWKTPGARQERCRSWTGVNHAALSP